MLLLLWLNIANNLLMLELNGLQRKNPLVLLVDAVQKFNCFLERQFCTFLAFLDLLVHLFVLFDEIVVFSVGGPIKERQRCNELIQFNLFLCELDIGITFTLLIEQFLEGEIKLIFSRFSSSLLFFVDVSSGSISALFAILLLDHCEIWTSL
jgi:hypothetical protein